jgi:xanthine dehydrogenase accessory factor
MAILADPVAAANGRPKSGSSDYYRRYSELIEKGLGCTEAVILTDQSPDLPIGSRFLFDASGQVTAQTVTGPLPSVVGENLVPFQRRPQPAVRHGIAYLPILPRITLLIVGGGHVGRAVARLASDVDFDIWVLDDRSSYASRERFPGAMRLFVGDIGSQLQELLPKEITLSTYCIIVTRGHAHDEEALYHLVRSPAAYVGMIGSKRKIKMIYEDLLAKGITPEDLRKVHAPLGFAIGSQTVDEIAVSIVAELIACRNLGRTIPAARIHVPV